MKCNQARAGAESPEVQGFADSLEHTSGRFSYGASMRAQEQWRNGLHKERERVAERLDALKKAERIKDPEHQRMVISDIGAVETICHLAAPIGWPIEDDDAVDESGIPSLSLVMQVDLIGRFKFDRSLVTFQNSFGELPARATYELTKMLYKTTTGASAGENLPKGIFMSKAELLTEYDRIERFRPGENTLDAFYAAGCYSKQFSRVMRVLRNIKDPIVKVELYNEYMERSQHQFKSLVLNGNLHSSHTLFAAKYIDRSELCVCGDLRKLVSTVFRANGLDTLLGDMEDQPFAEDVLSRTYWQVMCPSTFVGTSWTLEEMHKRHNERFFLMTPQNLKICNDMALSSIMYRLGQGNGWTYIGMPTAVCDAAAKLQIKTNVNQYMCPDTRKRPSAGLDLTREALDTRRTSHIAYIDGISNADDDSKVTQLKRTTASGIQTGFVLFVNGEIEKIPENELARDCMMPEGPPDGFEAMCQLLTAIPRDGDNNSELWTTVDKDKTNVRSKGIMKLIQGFSLYLVAFAKNFLFEGKTETRYNDLLIVCNVLASSGPPDLEGMYRRDSRVPDAFLQEESRLDHGNVRRGILHGAVNPKSKKKGDKPMEQDQQAWAPFHYFVHWIAGISVAMMNKMGSWNMLIDYGFKSVSDYLYHYELSSLKCLVSESDENNASRYYESFLARCIADCVLKTTMMCMLEAQTVSAAVLGTTRALSYDALHLSLLPVVHERLVARMLRYEPLLGMATIGLALDVPVVPLESLLQLFDGKGVRNQADLELVRAFCTRCAEQGMFVNRGGTDGGDCGMPGSDPIPYITSPGSWDSAGGGPLREKMFVGNNDKKVSSDILYLLSKKLYSKNEDVLVGSGFCKQAFSFHRCVQSLQSGYDLRQFFGGMSLFHNTRALFAALGIRDANRFPADFLEATGADPAMHVARLSGEVHCLSLRIWDALLWFSIMRRPRRDPGIVTEFAHTLVTFSMRTIPRSVFPYDVVPMTRLDPITKEQVVMDLRAGLSDDQDERMHGTIIRFKNPSIVTKSFTMECPGLGASKVLEDEMYMSTVYMLSRDIGCEWHQAPIDRWPVSLKVAFDTSYPFVRYANAVSWRGKREGFLRTARQNRGVLTGCVFMNPSRRSVALWVLPEESHDEFVAGTAAELEGWDPGCVMLHEFSLSSVCHPAATRCKSVDEAMRAVFSMGFGPCPYYRRNGVALHMCVEEGGEPMVGCIVPHRPGVHGCVHSGFRRCYMCPHNPFYEAVFASAGSTVRVLPMVAVDRVVEIGTEMLLSVHSRELQALVRDDNMRAGVRQKRKRRRFRYSNSGVPTVVDEPGHGDSADDVPIDRLGMIGGTSYIVVRLDTPRSFADHEGMVYVAIEVVYSGNKGAVDTRGMYVRPYDLTIRDNPQAIRGVRTHIMI